MFEDCLFRYRAFNGRNLEALRMNRLYFSTPINFNDPYDNLLAVDTEKLLSTVAGNLYGNMDSYLQKIKTRGYDHRFTDYSDFIWNENRDQAVSNFLHEVEDRVYQIQDRFKRYVKVICFSESCSSLLMWSHYSQNHEGFCIAYKREELNNAKRFGESHKQLSNKADLLPVEYTSEKVDMTGYIHNQLLSRHELGTLENYDFPDPPISILRECATRKYVDWAYEKEWRIVPHIFSLNEESPLCYIEARPIAIILGSQSMRHGYDVKEVFAYARENGIPLYASYLDMSSPEYKLNIMEIPQESDKNILDERTKFLNYQ